MQVFLGFTNFYRRFIYSYSAIAAPLTGLLKGSKDGKKFRPFKWSGDTKRAFRYLKGTFLDALFLRYFDPKKKLRLKTNTSNFDLGAVLI